MKVRSEFFRMKRFWWWCVPLLAGAWAFAELAGDDEAEKVAKIAGVLNESVDRRLEGAKEGGEARMALFSSYDHLEGSYERNDKLWCADIAEELGGVVVFKGGPGNHRSPGDSYGGVMITPRHILFCNHAHPAYPGSPPPWVNGLGFNFRFVTAEDEVIERELVWGGKVAEQDLWIGLLDRDVPASIKPYRIFPEIEGLGPAAEGRGRAVEVGFSQGSFRLDPEKNHVKFQQLCGNCETSHYGTRTTSEGVEHYEQVPMVYVSNTGAVDCDGSKGPELRAPFRYCVWDGDSGTPRFHLFGDELLLSRIVLFGGGGGISLGARVDEINAAIEAIDLEAVGQSKMQQVTGHQTVVASRKELEASVPR